MERNWGAPQATMWVRGDWEGMPQVTVRGCLGRGTPGLSVGGGQEGMPQATVWRQAAEESCWGALWRQSRRAAQEAWWGGRAALAALWCRLCPGVLLVTSEAAARGCGGERH